MELLNKAKEALAGMELSVAIIDLIATRRPDLVEQASISVMGGEANAEATWRKRVDAVTTFDPIAKRIAELETTLAAVRELAKRPSHSANGTRPDIQVRCTEVLNTTGPRTAHPAVARVAELELAVANMGANYLSPDVVLDIASKALKS